MTSQFASCSAGARARGWRSFPAGAGATAGGRLQVEMEAVRVVGHRAVEYVDEWRTGEKTPRRHSAHQVTTTRRADTQGRIYQ